ncbi:hypothetical protein [Psychroserpens luteus]|uniref:YD repeat-containing protein n=1 Tax=Psychroserpens luteus TaxID=1434066 RepID=A0ABW6A0D0_9FLAO|nr:hypothetical protein [Psychroserpens luteus]
MKKLNLLLAIIITLTIFSCTSDDNISSEEPELTEKKLTKVSEEGNYGIYEKLYIYNSDNNVTEMESSFTEFGQTASDLHNTVFSYENNLVVSAIDYENGALYKTYEFNYSNDNLTERIIYDSDGIEDERIEFTYNSNNEIESFDYYVDSILQQTRNFTYNTNGNIIIAEDIDYSEIEYDTNPTPSSNFTSSNKIIFGAESLIMNLCGNNETMRITNYNNSLPSETVRNFETTITYDTDNYPLSKVLVQTDNSGNEINTRTTTFEYE